MAENETLNMLEAAVARVIAPLAVAQAEMARSLAEMALAQAETTRTLAVIDSRLAQQGRHAELSFRALTSRTGNVEGQLAAERLERLEARVLELEAKLAANG